MVDKYSNRIRTVLSMIKVVSQSNISIIDNKVKYNKITKQSLKTMKKEKFYIKIDYFLDVTQIKKYVTDIFSPSVVMVL